jgi:hypothetical protein
VSIFRCASGFGKMLQRDPPEALIFAPGEAVFSYSVMTGPSDVLPPPLVVAAKYAAVNPAAPAPKIPTVSPRPCAEPSPTTLHETERTTRRPRERDGDGGTTTTPVAIRMQSRNDVVTQRLRLVPPFHPPPTHVPEPFLTAIRSYSYS